MAVAVRDHRAVNRSGRVLTCDPGIDDAVAMAVLAGRPDGDLRAVVAGAGNVGALTAWRNAVGLAHLFGLDVPVGIGSSDTLTGAPIHRPGDVHGADGLAGLAGRLTTPRGEPANGRSRVSGRVVSTGPLTDVARALQAGRPVEEVVWMGGNLGGVGGGSGSGGSGRGDGSPLRGALGGSGAGDASAPAAEFNALADPEAVEAVLRASVDVAIVPLDVTGAVALTDADLDRWTAASAGARFCASLARSRLRRGEVVLHDPVAVVAALDPGLFTWERHSLRCDLGDGGRRGALAIDPRPDRDGRPAARVAVGVDTVAVRNRIVSAVLACP